MKWLLTLVILTAALPSRAEDFVTIELGGTAGYHYAAYDHFSLFQYRAGPSLGLSFTGLFGRLRPPPGVFGFGGVSSSEVFSGTARTSFGGSEFWYAGRLGAGGFAAYGLPWGAVGARLEYDFIAEDGLYGVGMSRGPRLWLTWRSDRLDAWFGGRQIRENRRGRTYLTQVEAGASYRIGRMLGIRLDLQSGSRSLGETPPSMGHGPNTWGLGARLGLLLKV